MVLSFEQTKEIEKLKQDHKKEIFIMQNDYSEKEHKRVMEVFAKQLELIKEEHKK